MSIRLFLPRLWSRVIYHVYNVGINIILPTAKYNIVCRPGYRHNNITDGTL